MPTSRAGGRPSPVLIVILLAALATGAAAGLLGSALSPPPSGGGGPVSEVLFSSSTLSIAFVAVVVVTVGVLIVDRLRGGAVPIPSRAVVGVLAALLVAVLFVAAAHVFATGTHPLPVGGNASGPAGGGTAPINASNSTTPQNGSGGILTILHLAWPPSMLFIVVAALILVAGAAALPLARSLAAARPGPSSAPRPRPGTGRAVRGALREARRALDDGTDPRATVVALYGELLARVGPMVGGIDPQTPEEIRADHLVRLGIGGDSADALTRLFEEARYSSHRMGPEAGARATRAIREALRELERASP